ncbi:MAG: hypothetical protein ACTHNW_01955 [Mucilaginibacter sp.]
MPTQINPHNDFRIDGNPKQITVALAITDLYRRTEVYIGFGNGRGGRSVFLDNGTKYSVERGFPAGTTSVVVRNFGPEIIHVS